MNNFFFIIFFFIAYTYSIFLIFTMNNPFCITNIKFYNVENHNLLSNDLVKICIFYKNNNQIVTIDDMQQTILYNKTDFQKTNITLDHLYNNFIKYNNRILLVPTIITFTVFLLYYIAYRYSNYVYYKKFVIKLDNIENECSICLNKLCGKICITKCNHEYHFDSIDQWMNNADTCPNCRAIM